MNGAYHGKTFGALSVTYSEKYRKPFMPLLDGVKFVQYSDPSMLEQAIDDTIGSVIIEPIQGETGIYCAAQMTYCQRSERSAVGANLS